MKGTYRDGEQALRAQLEDLAWQRDVLFDKRVEAERELAHIEQELAALRARLTDRPRSERGWLWVLAVPFAAIALLGAALELMGTGHRRPRAESAKVGAETVKQAAELLVNTEDIVGCPTIEQLVAHKKLDAKKIDDPWGRPYHITCNDDDIRVTSAGKDGRFFTPDDIRDDFKPSDIKRVAELYD